MVNLRVFSSLTPDEWLPIINVKLYTAFVPGSSMLHDDGVVF